jgi:hypothetical protein
LNDSYDFIEASFRVRTDAGACNKCGESRKSLARREDDYVAMVRVDLYTGNDDEAVAFGRGQYVFDSFNGVVVSDCENVHPRSGRRGDHLPCVEGVVAPLIG